MSDHLENFSSPIKEDIALKIQELDLPLIQKHHVRLLIHCLEIFKNISALNDGRFPNDMILQNWCEAQARKINDKDFTELLLAQMIAAARKFDSYSKRINKNILDLNLEDLIDLVSQNS
tara:strand:- start:207 stop:563 length:357 start_codon:yes stop_codon:yes gene_type:complete